MNKPLAINQEISKLLNPITDLFTGADGGGAFIRLRHTILPEIMVQVTVDSDTQSQELIQMIRQMSKLCEIMLAGNN